MLTLTPQQLDRIEQLQARRQAAALLEGLGQAWPAVAARLGERWPAFVAASAERAQAVGLRTPAEQAGFISLCCLWGSGFETRPGHEWAARVLATPALRPALVLHQLTHQSREILQRRRAQAGSAQPGLSPAAFDQSLATLDAWLRRALPAGGFFLDLPAPAALQACDLDRVSFAVVDAQPLQAYQPAAGSWTRVALPAWRSPPQTLEAPPAAPVVLAVISPARGAGGSARLQLALETAATCGARHPSVSHHSAAGRLSWQGVDAARLSLPVHAPAVDRQAPPAGIGHGEPAETQQVHVETCGVRAAGAPLGQLAIQLQVHAATQHALDVHHGALPPLAWPPDAGTVPPAVPVRCQLQTDGDDHPAPAWLAAWQQLQGLTRDGLARLGQAWERALVPGTARLQAEAAPLAGQAALSWGWQRGADGSVALRLLGQIDFTALRLDLCLAGELDWHGSRARVQLRAHGEVDWRQPLDATGDAAALTAALAQGRCSWRLPFTARIEPISTGQAALLCAGPLAPALQGAVVGECGLRPRPDGRGHAWFYRLAIEAVHAQLLRQDPVGGLQQQRRELIPALTLLDWTAG